MWWMAVVLGLVWGGVWAGCLQWTDWGRFLAARRAWVTVVIGVGVDVLILLFVMEVEVWLRMTAVIGASAVGVVGRSLFNEWQEHMRLLEVVRGGDQDQVGE